jgi:HEAT repeat protein
MIGEEISAALVIENKGTASCSITTGGDYRSTGYPQRMKVRVRDENLNALPELPAEAYGFGGGGIVVTKTIPPGENESIDFPLECYVSFRRSGVYQITASHDLGWPVDDEHPRLSAQAELIVTEPTEAQATAYVENLFASRAPAPTSRASVFGYEINFEKQLSVLRHPVYLPSLAKAARDGSSAAVVGIGHIATPEATMALLRLLDHESPEIVTRAAQQILRRLPSAEDASRPALQGWTWSRHQVDPLLPSSWEPRFEKPLFATAVKMLDHADVEVVQVAALMMKARGEAEHAPAILAALQKSLDVYQAPRTGPDANTLDAPKPQQALISALDALRQRGWRTKGGRSAEAIAWFRQLADPAIPPPEDGSWKESALVWIENGPSALRMAALQAIPHPMSDAYEQALLRALEDRDWGVQRVACEAAGKSKRAVFVRPLVQIVEMASESFLRNAAVNAAHDCGARYELWQALTASIPNEGQMVEALRTLVQGTIDLPDSRSGGGNSGFTRDQRFIIRDTWRAFLAGNEAELAVGKRVRLTDHETISALTGLKFRPDGPAVEVKFPDGTVWPPRPIK